MYDKIMLSMAGKVVDRYERGGRSVDRLITKLYAAAVCAGGVGALQTVADPVTGTLSLGAAVDAGYESKAHHDRTAADPQRKQRAEAFSHAFNRTAWRTGASIATLAAAAYGGIEAKEALDEAARGAHWYASMQMMPAVSLALTRAADYLSRAKSAPQRKNRSSAAASQPPAAAE